MGMLTNIFTGLFIAQISVRWSVFISGTLAAAAPLLMATADVRWPYWYAVFWAQVGQDRLSSTAS